MLARPQWRQTSVHLPEIRRLAADLHSLQNALLSIKTAVDCRLGERESENIIIEDMSEQLRMVVYACEELCARADRVMGYTRERRGKNWNPEWLYVRERVQRSHQWLLSFTPVRKLTEVIISNLSRGKTTYTPDSVNLEKQVGTIDISGQALMQQAISVRNRVRAFVPDEDLPHIVRDWTNDLCFLLGTGICPLLTWLALRSLNLEPVSALDQRIMTCLPLTATLITIIVHTGATALPVWRSCTRGRSSAFVACWISLAMCGLLWSHIGGSNAALFLVFMPFALSFGVASGLLWHMEMTRRQ